MGWYGNGAGEGMWVVTGVFWVVLVLSLMWMTIRAMPWKGRNSAESLPGEQASPEEIIDRRFAQGKLDERTYREQRAVLLRERERDS
jgi:uncharacterized membrane protein